MQKSALTVILVLGALILSCCATGCVNANAAKIDQAKELVESANSRLSFMSSPNLTSMYVGTIRANGSAAVSDLNEAKKILDQVPLNELSPQEQSDMKALKVMIVGVIKMAEMVKGPFADFIEDSQVISSSKDPTTVSEKADDLKIKLQEIQAISRNINVEMDTVDVNTLSPRMKGEFINMKVLIQSLDSDLTQASAQLESACIKKCSTGEVLGTDCQCHPACGTAYCISGAICCKGTCYISPGSQYTINMDTCYFQ